MDVRNLQFLSSVGDKKLQFGTDKCCKVQVGKKIDEVCPEMHVDGWKMKEVKEIETGEIVLEDEYDGKTKTEKVLEEKYLYLVMAELWKQLRLE